MALGRGLGNFLRRIFPGKKPQPPQAPVPPPSPPGGGKGGEPVFDRYTSIYQDTVPARVTREIHDRTGYSRQEIIQAHLLVFLSHPGIMDEERPERYRLWAEYLEYMVIGGHTKEERRAFFADYGIDPSEFGWAEWRAAIGYSRRE